MNDKHPQIKHIFFDLDHTLWDFDKNSELAFAQIFQQQNININIKTFIDIYIPINNACWKLYENNQMSAEELRLMRLKQTFKQLNYLISDEDIEKIAEEYLSILPEFNHLFEHTLEILAYLSQKYTLHIITNGFIEVQHKKINNANMAHFFKTVTNSEMAGAKKPHKQIFQHALSLAQAHKAESIMIGDSMHADVQGALDFGIKALFCNHNDKEKAHNYQQITHLKELEIMF
jgi:putative hydrolase of the HAD superfamily